MGDDDTGDRGLVEGGLGAGGEFAPDRFAHVLATEFCDLLDLEAGQCGELGDRVDRALASVTKGDLAGLVADLPALAPAAPEAVRDPWWRRLFRPRRSQSVYKTTVRKSGAWTVPAVYHTSIYKGLLVLDLRQAVLTAAETVLDLSVYKSRVAIVVPPEFQVDLQSEAYKGQVENLTTGGLAGSPRVLVRGSAYKSTVVVTNRDLEAATLNPGASPPAGSLLEEPHQTARR